MGIQSGNDYDLILTPIKDAQSGAIITDASLTFTAYANWDGESGAEIPGATDLPMALAGSPSPTGTWIGVLPGSLGLTPSMNPVGIVVQASNYGVRRVITEFVAY